MLAYAAHRRPAARLQPKALALIVAGHAGLLFAVMTARGDIPLPPGFDRTDVIFIDPVKPPPPPPPPTDPVKPTESTVSRIDQPQIIVPIPKPGPLGPIDLGPPLVQPGSGLSELPLPPLDPPPIPQPAAKATVAARALTAAADLTPPYPDDKRRAGEEAVIRLTLAIDARGRVVDVTPLGNADPSFVEAARRHILKRWRYKPATEDGAAVASTQTVSIRFRLDR